MSARYHRLPVLFVDGVGLLSEGAHSPVFRAAKLRILACLEERGRLDRLA
jgi:hypothetical protein